MLSIFTGFAAGGLHVFSGVDHLAALAPVAVADPQRAGRTGMVWGLGHGIGVVLVGLLGLLLRGVISLESWSAWAELIVGFLIVGIGVWAIIRSRTLEIHQHEHDHDGGDGHEHLHAHEHADRRHNHAALGVGVFHGIAGGGHLFGVLPALALPTFDAILYLVSYLVASVVAMGAFGFSIGSLARRSGEVWITRLMLASGVVAIVVGLMWISASWPE